MGKKLPNQTIKQVIQQEEMKAVMLNQFTYEDFYNELSMICLNLFKWENAPKSFNTRFLEMSLFSQGYALAFNHPSMGVICLKCTKNGEVNIIGEPLGFRAFGLNSETYSLSSDECVFIRNNMLEYPSMRKVELRATRLASIQRSIDTNLAQIRIGKIIRCSETEKTNIINIFSSLDYNLPHVYTSKELDLNQPDILNIETPFIADKLTLQLANEWASTLTSFGVNNLNIDKKERLVVSEVESNNEHINLNLKQGLETRLEACEKINSMFRTNMKVTVNKELISEYERKVADGELLARKSDAESIQNT